MGRCALVQLGQINLVGKRNAVAIAIGARHLILQLQDVAAGQQKVNLGIKQDARSTESSIDERNRFASYHVVSEFVDPHDALRVSPCLAIHNNTEDAFCRVEIVGINWQNELRIVE